MEKKVFSGYGVDILFRDGKYFIRYDAGGIAVKMREDEISHEEAVKAQQSERDAYEIILLCGQREKEK